jgi:hypothetical protein
MSFEMEDLSFSTVELVKSLLAASPASPVPSVSEDLLVRYAFGWVTVEEEGAVMETLIRSSDLRHKLIGIRRSIDHTGSRSESVKRFLDHAVETAIAAYGAIEQGVGDWKSGGEGAFVIRHAIRALADRSRAGRPGLAFTRSANSLPFIESKGVPATMCAKLTDDGGLEVWGVSDDSARSPNRPLRLEIVDEVWGTIQIGTSEPVGGEWRFSVNHFGPWDSETLAATRFRVRFGDEAAGQDLGTIAVQTDAGQFMRCPLSLPPSVRDRELSLRVEFDSEFRTRYAERILDFALQAGPLSIPLRSWEVCQLPRDGRLSAPTPCSIEGPLPRAAITLTLRPTE